ncbi:MAG: tyrosine-type recombinase/integrase [Verrucomicrobiales bacterium]
MASAFQRKYGKWATRIKIWDAKKAAFAWATKITDAKTREDAIAIGEELERASRYAKEIEGEIIPPDRYKHMLDDVLRAAGVQIMGTKKWPLITEFVADYFDGLHDRVASTTLSTYITMRNHILEWIARQGGSEARLDWLTPKIAESYYRHALAGMTIKSANERIKLISRIYDTAVKIHDYPKNPFDALTLLDKRKSKEELKRIPFSLVEIKKILTHLKRKGGERAEDWRRAVMLAATSGCRLEDAVSMSSNNLVDGILSYEQIKTGKSIACPIGRTDWAEYLGDQKGDLCPSLLTEFRRHGTRRMSSEFTAIVSAAGVDQEYQQFKSGRKIARKTFHSLRHTLRSAIVSSGGTDAQADLVLGHSAGQGKAYTHADLTALGEIIGRALKGL